MQRKYTARRKYAGGQWPPLLQGFCFINGLGISAAADSAANYHNPSGFAALHKYDPPCERGILQRQHLPHPSFPPHQSAYFAALTASPQGEAFWNPLLFTLSVSLRSTASFPLKGKS